MAKTFEMMFNIAARLGSGFTNAFSSASSVMSRMQNNVMNLKSNIKTLDSAYKQGIINAESYANAHKRMTRELEKAYDAQKKLGKAMANEKSIRDKKQTYRDNIWDTAETALAVGAPVMASMKMESVMADVKKVVDFDSPEQMKAMQKDIVNISKTIPMTAAEIGKIIAEGGQARIPREDLLTFGKDAAIMGVAFDMAADVAGKSMAQWRSSLKLTQDEVRALGDQVNYVGNNSPVKAKQITAIIDRIASLGGLAGISAGNIAALSGAMIGVPEEVAATGLKKVFTTLTAGSAATKGQIEAFQALGFSAEELAKSMQTDGAGTFLNFIDRIKQLPDYEQLSMFKEVFGEEGLAAIGILAQNRDMAAEFLQAVGDESKYAGSMLVEFNAKVSTTESKLKLAKNNADAVGMSFGDNLLQPIKLLADGFSSLMSAIDGASAKYPELTKWVAWGVGGFLTATVAASALGYAYLALKLPFALYATWATKIGLATKLSAAGQWLWNAAMVVGRGLLSAGRLVAYYTAMGVMRAFTIAWAGAQWLLNAAMLANPIGLIIAGIGLLVGAGYLLIENWDTVKAWFITLWDNPKLALQQFIDGIYNKFGSAFKWLEEKWVALKSMFSGGGVGSVDVAMGLPGHATGGIFDRPHLAWFAEAGPEAAIPLDGSPRAVSLWQQAGEMLGVSPGGGGISVTFAPVINAAGGNAQEIRQMLQAAEDDLIDKLQALQHQQRRTSYA